MLAFAHIPTGTTANRGFDRDEVISNIIEPASALTTSGADIEIRQGYTLRRGSGCLTIGVHLNESVRKGLSHKPSIKPGQLQAATLWEERLPYESNTP
jgi:hypothetical protein